MLERKSSTGYAKSSMTKNLLHTAASNLKTISMNAGIFTAFVPESMESAAG
jgi:hypothetical protein